MVTYCVTKILPTCSPVIGQFFDTMIVASIDRERLQWRTKSLNVLENVLSHLIRLAAIFDLLKCIYRNKIWKNQSYCWNLHSPLHLLGAKPLDFRLMKKLPYHLPCFLYHFLNVFEVSPLCSSFWGLDRNHYHGISVWPCILVLCHKKE